MEDPFDRMVQVAAFAVSSYAGTEHRASSKPFNPILGETYEYVREDLGFKFISEQVHINNLMHIFLTCYVHVVEGL